MKAPEKVHRKVRETGSICLAGSVLVVPSILNGGSVEVELDDGDLDRIRSAMAKPGEQSTIEPKPISDERLSALIGFVNMGLDQLTDEDRVGFVNGLGRLFCLECGKKLPEGSKCFCHPCYDE